MQLDLPAPFAASHGIWRAALLRLVLAVALIAALTAQEWAQMAWQWWNSDPYSHILLIPPILAWLVWLRRDTVHQERPFGWWPGLVALAVALIIWAVGRIGEWNVVAQAGAVGAVQSAIVALLGLRVVLLLALPVGFAVFLVPFGDEIVAPLQFATAEMSIGLLRLFGIPATIEGVYIETPAGLFIVAEACAGVRFLVAMAAIGVLTAFTAFVSWKRRIPFLLACLIVPILANGVRAFATIAIAQRVGAEAAGGFDHIVYGWFFFGLVVALILGVAWRWFDRTPEEAGWSRADLDAMPLVERAAGLTVDGRMAFGGIVVLIGLTASLATASGLL